MKNVQIQTCNTSNIVKDSPCGPLDFVDNAFMVHTKAINIEKYTFNVKNTCFIGVLDMCIVSPNLSIFNPPKNDLYTVCEGLIQ